MNSIKYICQHSRLLRQPKNPPDYEVVRRIKDPLESHQYSSSGRIEFQYQQLFVSLSYSTPRDIHRTLSHQAGYSFKRLRSFKMVMGNNIFDLRKLPVDDLKIFFTGSEDSDAFIIDPDNIIMIDGNPMSIDGILSILHEIGHCLISDSTDENSSLERIHLYQKLYQGLPFTYWESADLLRNEYRAWDYALGIIKPYICHIVPIDKLAQYIYYSSIQDYIIHIHKCIDAKKKNPVSPGFIYFIQSYILFYVCQQLMSTTV